MKWHGVRSNCCIFHSTIATNMHLYTLQASEIKLINYFGKNYLITLYNMACIDAHEIYGYIIMKYRVQIASE